MASPCSNTYDCIRKNQTQALNHRLYEKFCKIIYEKSRIALGTNKKELVVSRISKRLPLCNVRTFEEYFELLNSNEGKNELTFFIDAISTNHTFFFREPAHYEFLKAKALPDIISGKPINSALKIWSTACSTGEEAYSIGIIIDQFFQNAVPRPWSILCSDISTHVLAIARDGIFAKERVQQVPAIWIDPYFERGIGSWNEFYRVKNSIRAHLQFQQLNLFDVPYPFYEAFDIIFCRNVLIYFDRPSQQEVILNLIRYLAPGGYLMTGHSESLAGINHPLKSIQAAIYQKKLT